MIKDISLTNKPNDSPVTYTLTIQNTVAEIARMSEWLTDALVNNGVANSIQFRFDLCANEAVTNIVSYAYPDKGTHDIALLLCINPDTIVLTIEDDGIAFNPFVMPEHAPPASLADAKIGGLGIDLIRHYIDEYSYKRLNDRNSVSMLVRRLPD